MRSFPQPAVVLMLEAFCDANALSTAIGLLAATSFGLGLAQSVSRSARRQSTHSQHGNLSAVRRNVRSGTACGVS